MDLLTQPFLLPIHTLSLSYRNTHICQDKMKAITLLFIYALLCFALQSPSVEAVTCDATQLSPCAGPILYGRATTPACCSALRAQQPCFCQYAKNPLYAGYISGSNSRHVASACSVSLPRC
jgi:hypothetical protein